MSTQSTEASLGEVFARRLAAKDRSGLLEVLAPDIDFRGMTPGRFWEASTPEGVLEVVFGSWFADSDHIEQLVSVDSDRVVDRGHVRYRVLVRNDAGPHLVEQHAYFDESDGRIGWLRVMCSGYRPLDA